MNAPARQRLAMRLLRALGLIEPRPALAARPGATGWIVYDQGVHDECLPFTDFRNCVEAGAELWASSADQLAEVTGLPIGTVKSTCHKALRKMRVTLDDEVPGPHPLHGAKEQS